MTLTVLVGVLVVAQLGNQVHYGTLYSELEPNDAGAIVEKLKAQQIPYKLEQNGTAIQVPEERVAALRLELASGGLPKGGGVGFEIFDRSQIGATEFEQQVSLRRALEGEISRSIMTIDGVKAARVHLVVPERRLFVSREETASASVVLSLRNSTEFGKKEVGSIVHLVSAAVPGLSRNRVSVVSSDGVTLHRPSDEGGGIDSESESEQGQNVSSKMENDVRAQLERVVGAGQADVRVNVALDRDSKERTEEHFEPTKNSLRSEHKVEESSGTAEAGVAGVPGALSNLPDTAEESAATATTTTAAGNLIRRVQTRNWEVDRVTQKTLTPRGGIRRVSVAVLLNGKYVKKGNKQVYVPRSTEELATLEAVVKSAVGFDEARGDVVHLANAEFSRIDDEVPAAPPPPRSGRASGRRSRRARWAACSCCRSGSWRSAAAARSTRPSRTSSWRCPTARWRPLCQAPQPTAWPASSPPRPRRRASPAPATTSRICGPRRSSSPIRIRLARPSYSGRGCTARPLKPKPPRHSNRIPNDS